MKGMTTSKKLFHSVLSEGHVQKELMQNDIRNSVHCKQKTQLPNDLS